MATKKCPMCKNDMEKQPYQHPYITHSGKAFMNVKVDVYKCPKCGAEQEKLPNEEDGYSAGAGLFSED